MACNKNFCKSPEVCCTNNNVCEKVCIEVDKVFDVCIQQKSIPTTLDVAFSSPPTGYSVTSLTNSAQGVLTGLDISPIEGSRCSRVRYTLTVPIIVVATNTAGNQITGTAFMVFNQDLVLYVPKDGIVVPTVKAIVSIEGINNAIINDTTVTTEACVTLLTKVVADVIIVVQSYGYPKIRPCEVYAEDGCARIFENSTIFPR